MMSRGKCYGWVAISSPDLPQVAPVWWAAGALALPAAATLTKLGRGSRGNIKAEKDVDTVIRHELLPATWWYCQVCAPFCCSLHACAPNSIEQGGRWHGACVLLRARMHL